MFGNRWEETGEVAQGPNPVIDLRENLRENLRDHYGTLSDETAADNGENHDTRRGSARAERG